MTSVTFARSYLGVVQGTKVAADAGITVDLSDDLIAGIAADQPGTFAAPEPEPDDTETRALDAPPSDRMVRKAPKKRGA